MLGKTGVGVSRAREQIFQREEYEKGNRFFCIVWGCGGQFVHCWRHRFPCMRQQETETIEDGVYIGNIYVGGMTEEEAVSAVEAYVESADSAEMTLKTGDKSVSVTAAELGISLFQFKRGGRGDGCRQKRQPHQAVQG